MDSGNGDTQRQDLDALFPGVVRAPAVAPRAAAPIIRIGDLPAPPADPQPLLLRPLCSPLTATGARVSERSVRLSSIQASEPVRMSWTPVLAGTALRMWELAPGLFVPEISTASRLLSAAIQTGRTLDDPLYTAAEDLALAGVMVLRSLWPEERALAELGLQGELSLAGRVQRLEQRFAATDQPAAWLALHLPSAVTLSLPQVDQLLLAHGPFRELGRRFADLAERQGMQSWEEALRGTIRYWSDMRGSAFLHAMIWPATLISAFRAKGGVAASPSVAAAAPRHPRGRKLEHRLAQAKQEAERARADAESWRARVADGEREIAALRGSRDRAVERLRRVVAENARFRMGADARPARSESMSKSVVVVLEATPGKATVRDTPLPSLKAVFEGREVYLYTGIERAAAREAMARALAHLGARCELFNGNRVTLLGPERFPAEALVIIETSHLSHSASGLIEARARSSGAWVFVGATGSSALPRRVAERWWRTHRGEERVSA